MHVALMVLTVKSRYSWMSNRWIARQVGIARPHLVAFLAGRGHVGERKQRRLRRWCRGLLG